MVGVALNDVYGCKICGNEFFVRANQANPYCCPFCAAKGISFIKEYECCDISVDPNGELPFRD